MNEGWTCPVCRRGVAPTEKHCDHGNPLAGPVRISPFTTTRPPLTSDPLPYLPSTTCVYPVGGLHDGQIGSA